MASVHVIARSTANGGRRYLVRYRVGGRDTKLMHAGSFPTRREAEERARWIGGELAALRVPDLKGALEPPPAPETLRQLADRYIDTRVDLDTRSAKTYRQAFAHLGPFGDLPADAIRPADVQAWIAALSAARLSPKTVRVYLGAIRGVLDFTDQPVNPARSPRIKLPKAPAEEVDPPTTGHVAALIDAISPKYRLPVRVLDWTGLRVGELAQLTWGDLDFRASRLRVARGRTKGGTAGRRWVPLPHHLIDQVAGLVPPEDRDLSAPVLRGFSDQGLRLAMGRACKHAGIPAYSPHDLRHRYITLLVMAEVPLPVIRQVVGHSRASVTLDTYSHVMLDEPDQVLAERRELVMGRRPGDAPVMPRDHADGPRNEKSPAHGRGFHGGGG